VVGSGAQRLVGHVRTKLAVGGTISPILLPLSQNKCNSRIQNLSHKRCNFDIPTIKEESSKASHSKRQANIYMFLTKTRGNLVILHLPLVCVSNFRIAFILGQNE
jgi:hypothetical protein